MRITSILCPKCGLSDHVKQTGVFFTPVRRIKWQRFRCNNELCSYKFKEWNPVTGLCDGAERLGQPVWCSPVRNTNANG